MRIYSADEISIYLNDKYLDIRMHNNARWIDQKCTPDVITILADCIVNYHQDNDEKISFTTKDVWLSDFTVQNVQNIFKKPDPSNVSSKNEYDKFFQQPMELFSYAKILKKTKIGNRNYYEISNFDLLKWLSIREKNSLLFLNKYIEKVLNDSGIYDLFDDFFNKPTKSTFRKMKDGYVDFIIQNTPINKKTEVRRIFTKILNPLSYMKNSYGTEGGYLSKHKITYFMLMYNRDNFRDIYSDKPKDMTRKEFLQTTGYKPSDNVELYKYQSQKAKKLVREYNAQYNAGLSELYQENHSHDDATQMHHIFPESEFSIISGYPENIIALTPTQHLNYAHIKGNTHAISEEYQQLILLAKNETIKQDYINQIRFYDSNNFIFVLSVGFDKDYILDIDSNDFISITREINSHFS